jgi:putative transposase
MRELRRAAHWVSSLHHHFLFTTKYRKPVFAGEIGRSFRDLIRGICRSEDIEILEGHVRPDHVHLLLSAPPHLAPSRVMQAIQGQDLAPSPPRLSKAAGDVLRAPVVCQNALAPILRASAK